MLVITKYMRWKAENGSACKKKMPGGKKFCRLTFLSWSAFFLAFFSVSAYPHTDDAVLTQELDAEISAAAQRDVVDPMTYLRRAESHRKSEQWDDALADYAVAEEVGMTRVPLFRSQLYLDKGEPDKALSDAQQFLESEPGSSFGLVKQAYAYGALNKCYAAAESMSAALLTYVQPVPDYFLDLARWRLCDNDQAAAIQALDDGIHRVGAQVALIDQGIAVLSDSGDFSVALEWLDLLPASLRSQPAWLFRKGELLLGAGNNAAALEMYLQASEQLQALPADRRSQARNQALMSQLAERLVELESIPSARLSD